MDFKVLKQVGHNYLCRSAKMRCVCTQHPTSYDGLNEEKLMELSLITPDKDTDEEEMTFYNTDETSQDVIVERNLCVSDLCQLLALKNGRLKDLSWCIAEYWPSTGIERILEDHEYPLIVQREAKGFRKNERIRYTFKQDETKYAFFKCTENFFHSDNTEDDMHLVQPSFADRFDVSNLGAMHNLIQSNGYCPLLFSQVWHSHDSEDRNHWCRIFLFLKDKKLYTCHDVQVANQLIRNLRDVEESYNAAKTSNANDKFGYLHEDFIEDNGSFIGAPIADQTESTSGLKLLASLSDYHIYTTINAKNHFNAPTEFGLVLRHNNATHNQQNHHPHHHHHQHRNGLNNAADTENEKKSSLLCITCDSHHLRNCWVSAMRLAKYGKQLRENYRAFKNKNTEHLSPKESYGGVSIQSESDKSRVAMDFTGSVGRIVDDPKEAKAIEIAEGYAWQRRLKPRGIISASHLEALEGSHVSQPWFHKDVTREEATYLVLKQGAIDGVFLVRESRSNPGTYVLTYRCHDKVLHTQITPLQKATKIGVVYTLDGFTKFYDLVQLVEFYQLNAGCLSTKLTYYVNSNSCK